MKETMTAKVLADRIANSLPREGGNPSDPFAGFAKRMQGQFFDDLAATPEQFPRTVAFISSRSGRVITDKDNMILGQLYAEESAAIRSR